MKQILPITLIAWLISGPLLAQPSPLIKGRVSDRDTGAPLKYANIQIVGTYQGTISNDEGRFSLNIKRLPARLLITYIGYEPREIDIRQSNDSALDIALTPTVIEMPSLTVTGDDPAVAIMRKVIEQKKTWWPKLNTYRADAYCRTSFFKDSSVAWMTETVTESYWDKVRGSRDIIKALRQTSSQMENDFMPSMGHLPNFYQDDIRALTFQMINVIHPDALKHYRFTLKGQRTVGEDIFYEIGVSPKSKLQSAFEGTVTVHGGAFTLAAIDLSMPDHLIFMTPIEHVTMRYRQQFSAFGGDIWLPVSLIREGVFVIAMPGMRFPPVRFKEIYEIRDYAINPLLPDSLFQSEEPVRMDSASIAAKSDFAGGLRIPLSTQEIRAYEEADSNMTFIQAYPPTGILGKLAIEGEEQERQERQAAARPSKKWRLSPDIRANRVQGLHAALTFHLDTRPVNFHIKGGYDTWSGRTPWSAGAQAGPFSLRYSQETQATGESDIYHPIVTSLSYALGAGDPWDYYENEKWQAGIQKSFAENRHNIALSITRETHASVTQWRTKPPMGRHIERPNPPILSGTLRTVTFQWAYGQRIPFGVAGQKRIVLNTRHALNTLQSGSPLAQYQLTVDWRMATALRRRLLSNALDIRAVAGLSTGENLPQYQFMLDGRLGAVAFFGAFKSLKTRPMTSRKYAALFWEHNFRSVIFEWLGWRKPAEMGLELILHGASAATWQATWQERHEIGFSINKLFTLLRCDFTWRLDEPGFFISLAPCRFL